MLNVFEAMDRTMEESMRSMNSLFDRMSNDHFGDFSSFNNNLNNGSDNRAVQINRLPVSLGSNGFQDQGNGYTYGIKMSRDAAKKTKINEKDGMLFIRYQDSQNIDRSNDNSSYRSSSMQMMSKSVSIPSDADQANTTASYQDGSLTITIPKRQ